ncbi:MAG TPA: ABC transporter ATP-binding protein [Actinomycetota bacterium]|jgi:molybdate transport system ATP-binding protein|nr:ABC transporter ATP-binding protein [Actinomycetota bacterium]
MSLRVEVRARRGGFAVQARLDAEDGETVALLGPNGAGKSTLVEVLSGLLPPEHGAVVLDGRVLDDVRARIHVPPEARPVGVVFQDRLLFPHLSAVENAAFPLRARGVPRDEARRRASELLARLGLSGRDADRPASLSGGQAQRVALARAVIHGPRLLLLDEPLSALDVSARAQLRALIREVVGSFPGARLLVTHDPVEATTLADRMVIVEEGRVTQSGTPRQIRDRPRSSYAADLVGLNWFSGRLERMPDGAGRIRTSDGDVVVGWPPDLDPSVTTVFGLLRPADVAIHARPPEGSARNVVHGRVGAVAADAERVRVHIASRPPVVAEITTGSLDRLGLRPGDEVWASFKAVEVRVVPP